MYGLPVSQEIALRVVRGQCRLAEHVERISIRAGRAAAGARQRGLDAVAENELVAQRADRQLHRSTHQRRGERAPAARAGHAGARQPQRAGQRAAAAVLVPVDLRQPVAHQSVRIGGIGHAQQRLRQRQQCQSGRAVERKYRADGLDATPALVPSQAFNQPARHQLAAFECCVIELCRTDQRWHALGFIGAPQARDSLRIGRVLDRWHRCGADHGGISSTSRRRR